MKVDYKLNALFALIAPMIHVLLSLNKESMLELTIGIIITYLMCYCLMCIADILVIWARKKIHGSNT
jgi:hypothetical protein